MIEVKTSSFEDYNISIPKNWNYKHDSERAIFISDDNNCSLTISVFTYNKKLKSGELKDIFENYVNTRIKAEKEATKNDIKLTPIQINSENEFVYTRFNGLEKNTNRFFECLIIAENGKIITAYVESINIDQKKFLILSDKILTSLEVK